ncbi:DUF5696 domain-containing protein [Paenibacillus sp. NPDC058174]|uniref:DUF5696 domain-containing protein n=1 Tax=Paenibacillus sp. NPDC058174 TaxID=3346366 RepID=UPI0036DF88E9
MANFIKRLSLRVKLVSFIVLALVLVIVIVQLVKKDEVTPAQAMIKAGIEQLTPDRAAVLTGQEWKPSSAGADGFSEALSNADYTLYVDPATTQVAVADKRSGFRWTSNPSKEQLEGETVKGNLLTNLQSPFVLTYVRTQGKDQTIREVTNALDPKIKKSISANESLVQVTYTLPEKNLSFSIQYELTKEGLKARIPTDGIKEEGEYAVFSIELLPYFGAASAKEDGYLFVPDGPGGLIKFEKERAGVSRGYSHQVYGLELTNAGNWSRSGERRENIAYPVFGVKRGNNAFVAVLTKGGDSANISAMPPGLKSTFYNIFSGQIYREEYLYRMSRLAAPMKAIQKERLQSDREVEYRFLSGKDADYVGMAKSYRSYLEQAGKLGESIKPVEHVPLTLRLMGGNFAEAYSRIQYVAATTFPQATEIANTLYDRGVKNMDIIYYGWQNKGDYDLYKRFPIEPKLGGESAARDFISEMRKKDIDVMFEDDFVWINQNNSELSGKNNGIRGIDGTVFIDEGWFISKPERTVAMAYETIDKLKDIGVSGILYNWVGEMVFHDYDKSLIGTRENTINVYEGLLDYTQKTLGHAGVYRGNDYTIAGSNIIVNMPSESSYDFMVDETVPFYPIAVHGYTSYTFGDGNLRNDVEEEFLKAIEYGATPSFFLTHDESRKLKYTASGYLFSSQYDKWTDRILQEYEAFDSLSGLYAQRIDNHEKLSKDVFATTYEDGTRVVVDYGRKTFYVEKGVGA